MQKNKWLVVFLIHADFRDTVSKKGETIVNKVTRLELETLVKDLQKVCFYPKNVRIFIIYRFVWPSNATSEDRAINGLEEVNGVEKNVHLLEVEHGAGGNRLRSKKIFPSGIHIQKRNSLIRIFKNLNLNADERVLFFVWGHGNTFSMFEEDWQKKLQGISKKLLDLPSIREDNDACCQLRPDNAILDKKVSTYLNVLSFEELSQAIFFSFGPSQIDLLVMMTCLASNMISLYALRQVTDYLVAPQTDIGEPGYAYKRILELIDTRPGVSNDFLCNFILRSYTSIIAERRPLASQVRQVSLAGSKPGNVINLINALKEFSILLIAKWKSFTNSQKELYIKAYRDCNRFDTDSRLLYNIDICEWCKNLVNAFPDDKDIFMHWVNINLEIGKVVPYFFDGVLENLIETKGDGFGKCVVPVNLPSGLSIFYPEDVGWRNLNLEAFVERKSRSQSQFFQHFRWWRLFYKTLKIPES